MHGEFPTIFPDCGPRHGKTEAAHGPLAAKLVRRFYKHKVEKEA